MDFAVSIIHLGDGLIVDHSAENLGILEREEIAAYACASDRYLATLSRAAARIAASVFVFGSVAAHQWTFERAVDGSRRLWAPEELDLHVSVSDAEGVVAILIDRDQCSGIDVEPWAAPLGWRSICRRFFSSTEVEVLDGLGEAEGAQIYILLWTGKEALAKATGLSLAEALKLSLLPPACTEVGALATRGAIIGHWNIRWLRQSSHVAAVCRRDNAGRRNRACPSFYVQGIA